MTNFTIAGAIVRQAENEQGTDAPDSGKPDRKKVSKRSFLAKDKTEAERMEDAAGGRYTLLVPEGNIDFDYIYGENANVDRSMAIFGFHTKVGNVCNTVLNDKEEPGTPADAGVIVKDYLAGLAADGTWAERAGGVAGQRIDKDALAGSIIAVMLANKLITPDEEGAKYALVRDKLESDPVYVRNSRQVPAVASEYNTRVGKAAKTVDSLMI